MITLQLDSVFLTFIIEKCSFGRQKVIEKCNFGGQKLLREVFSFEMSLFLCYEKTLHLAIVPLRQQQQENLRRPGSRLS